MAKCNPELGKYIACFMMYREDIIPKDVNGSIALIKNINSIKFVDWVPIGFKYGINYQSSTVIQGGEIGNVMRSLCMISNSNSISQVFSKICRKFDRCSRESFAALEFDYKNNMMLNLMKVKKVKILNKYLKIIF